MMNFLCTVAKEHPSIWLHVDAAWAGVTLACPEYRDRAQLAGINKWVTSLCVNFHKVSVSDTLVTTYRWSIDCCVTFVVGFDELRRVCVMGAGSKSPHRCARCNTCVLEDETWRCWSVDCFQFAF